MEDISTPRKKKNIVELTQWSVAQYRALPKRGLCVVADNVRSLHNIGSIFRTSDAFRIDHIFLCGISGCPPHPEISKTALGAEDSVAWSHEQSALECAVRLQEQGWKICVLEQAHGSIPLPCFRGDSDCRYALVVGNEVEGVDQRIVDLADYVLEIPQEGTKHSLNVACSAAIALYALSVGLKPIGGDPR